MFFIYLLFIVYIYNSYLILSTMAHSLKREMIIDLAKNSGKKACVDFVKSHMETHGLEMPSLRAVSKCVDTCIKADQKFKKNKGRPGSEESHYLFLQESLPLPVARQRREQPVPTAFIQDAPEGRLGSFMESVYEETVDKLATELHQANKDHESCSQNLNSSIHEKEMEQQELLKEKRAHNRTKRRLNLYKTKLLTVRGQNKFFQKSQRSSQQKLDNKRKDFKRVSSSAVYHQKKVNKLQVTVQELTSQLAHIRKQHDDDLARITHLEKTNNNLYQENEWLREMVQEDKELVTFRDGCYSSDMQQCVYKLLENHVSVRKVPGVIEAALKLAGKTANHLPSKSTVTNMNVQRLILAQKQVAEEFPHKRNLTLLSDETTKHTTKLEGIHAADSDGRLWVLGLRELLTKSAKDVYQVLQDILSDVDERASITDNKLSQSILANISSRLSDRAATELKFGQMLEETRKELLPLLHEGFAEMSLEDQTAAGRILVFSCGLHSLIHFAECCAAGLVEAEKGLLGEDAPAPDPVIFQKGEPGTIRLIRTACKAFVRGADMKNGCHILFSAFVKPFLREHHLRSLPLASFKGNRFNIVFSNGGHIFFLRKKMTEFLEGNSTNRLLRAVLHDLKCPEYIAGCKAMGLISKFVTTPLWHVLEDKDLHIMDMGLKYSQLIDFINKAAASPDEFMTGRMLAFGEGTVIKQDCVLAELIAPFPHDDKVQTILGILLPALAKLAVKLFSDLLPGGCHYNSSPEVRSITKGTPKHNKFSESVFAYVDNLMVSRPNISVLACEAYIMYANNRTAEWLTNKKSSEIATLLAEARRETRKVREQFQQRHEDIQKARLLKIKENMEKAQEAERRKLAQLEKFTSAIVHHGLWQSVNEMDSMLTTYSSPTAKLESVKAQLRFRQHVFHQASEASIYAFSKKVGERRVNMTWEELAANLRTLICDAGAHSIDDDNNIYVGRRIRHRFVERILNQEIEKWYHGKVISQVPGYPTWFNVVYDEDAAVYTFQLQQDVDRGDLQILIQ